MWNTAVRSTPLCDLKVHVYRTHSHAKAQVWIHACMHVKKKKQMRSHLSLSFFFLFLFFFYLFIFRTNVNLNVYSRSQVCRDSEATVLSEKRKEVACMFKKRKEKKSFGLFRFEFFVFHSRRPLTLILKCVGDERTRFPRLAANRSAIAQNSHPTTYSREDCFKSQPWLTWQSQKWSERGTTHHHRQSFCVSLPFNGHVRPSSLLSCDYLTDIGQKIDKK